MPNRASVKPTYGVNYILIAAVRRNSRLKASAILPIFGSVRPDPNTATSTPVTQSRPRVYIAHVSISPAYLWRNCVCACAQPRVCRSVICSYWTSCIGQPIIRVPQVHEWQVSHVAISGFWPLIAVEVWKINRSIVHRISSWLVII